MRDLLIVGSGGFSRETAELVRAINDAGPAWRLLGFLDDDPAKRGTPVQGLPVLGPAEAVHDHPAAQVVVGIGSPRDNTARERVTGRLGLPPERYATLVHPTAVVSRSSTLGPGTVVGALTVLTASVTVGAHVAISPHVVLTHDDVVEDFVTFAAGVRVAGAVRIGACAYVGAGALIREGLTVGARSLVGMGAGVVKDVPPGEVWAGTPARFLRAN
ncbi:acetyltransferase [Streptosporangium carneum]|uniref:Transferase n=1 Tax=Streptosporangium carneum TaxID=47481 RepID=A0A9W6I961_9ACTN|nr:acetyltransferase [Streptosporangium carneum]GLK14357.1 transferase [Streptosporangium carneum]